MAKKISDYRPISLITSLYKIIAKVLTGRLRGILHETIHSTQRAFVQGRQILDAVLIANEIVDEKKRSGEEGVVFKIDFEKAYDHVSWDFLDHVMEKKGFNPRWRKWMRDDTIFFSSTREEDLLSLKSVLLVFGHISGLKVNLDKSNIYGINLGQNHFHRLVELLDCKASGWPHTLPGSSSGWEPQVWITLIQSCLTHMPCYFLSLFKIPASVPARIERLQRDFLWSGVGEGKRDHLVSWDVVCNPKTKGGLGLGRISLRNSALLGKWLWRYPREGSALWHQDMGKEFDSGKTCGEEINLWGSVIQDYLE
ncbi:putative ribonuclease H protein [Vitis vinifera]|uniref:Putative ribonuclease H protein n=1 Tax=Vitis vinifera TaxID=29760 RepID=A0A438I6W1_VITVI|nr:putative ribonuclease H protein [Vitis vinifera]